jgi:hypothetical protein
MALRLTWDLIIIRWLLMFVGIATIIIWLVSAHAQDKPPAAPTLTPTEVQSLRLQVRQKDAVIAKQALDSAQAKFQQALADLNAEAERVKTENKWDKSVAFDMNDLHFTAVAKEPAKDKAAAVKP